MARLRACLQYDTVIPNASAWPEVGVFGSKYSQVAGISNDVWWESLIDSFPAVFLLKWRDEGPTSSNGLTGHW